MQYAFGPKRGLWFIIPFQLIVMVSAHHFVMSNMANELVCIIDAA